MNDAPHPSLDRGVLLALGRDHAKQLFAAKQPELLQEFLESLLADAKLQQQNAVTDLAGLWQPLQDVLTKPELVADEADRQGLALCLLGGRPLPGEPALIARLVRPDVVPQLSVALAKVSPEAVGGGWSDEATKTLAQERFAAIVQLYKQAAAERAAIVFAACQT